MHWRRERDKEEFNCIRIHYEMMEYNEEMREQFNQLQLQTVCYSWSNLLEGHRVAGYSLEAHAVQREPGELAHFHLPLNKLPALPLPMGAEYEVSVLALEGDWELFQGTTDLFHHALGVHVAGGLHTPGEPQGTWLVLRTPRERRRFVSLITPHDNTHNYIRTLIFTANSVQTPPPQMRPHLPLSDV